MKITLNQLQTLIKETVKDQVSFNEKISVKTAASAIKKLESIKEDLQDIFDDKNDWQSLEQKIDFLIKKISLKHNSLEKNTWKHIQQMKF
jgi:myosin-crossreactive antigen